MLNWKNISKLIEFIQAKNGIANKRELAELVKREFNLVLDRSVYYCDDFAIRFSQSESVNMSNVVLSLSKLQKYDDIPVIVCIVSTYENHLLLMNTSFLKKISHSSKQLRIDNIRGSILGNDIMKDINGIANIPSEFERLWAIHLGFTFEENLERLVEATGGIVGRVHRFPVGQTEEKAILNSALRAEQFLESSEYFDLKADLDMRVAAVQNEIAIAAFIDNVNIRGRVIEYLITNDGSTLKEKIINALNNREPLPVFATKDELGDYKKTYVNYNTQTDIKTKVLFLNGNPKAYNIDKLLKFLAEDKAVYMIYIIGVNEFGDIVARLCSAFDRRLIDGTNIVHHWAGRDSRGAAQFVGNALSDILNDNETAEYDKYQAQEFIKRLIDL